MFERRKFIINEIYAHIKDRTHVSKAVKAIELI